LGTDHSFTFILRMVPHGDTTRLPTGVALFIIEPDPHAELTAIMNSLQECFPGILILEVVLKGDIGNNAPIAILLQKHSKIPGGGLFLVRRLVEGRRHIGDDLVNPIALGSIFAYIL
jgi:hypothetical protein